MSKYHANRNLPVFMTIVVALMLTMMPLPDSMSAFRPDWVALIILFWAMTVPRSYGVGAAFITGIFVDVAQATLLGQYALALVVITYITVKSHLLIRVFPLLQLTATIFALLALYQFLLFWINGVAGVEAPAVSYWGPVITGTLIWPLLYSFMSNVRNRVQLGN
ncbi:MAG: rod shape-determining protein MreD [Proteobacteria bacterium]|nr:rod shape-determining protein MreD [Pseudomonadota bacterium]